MAPHTPSANTLFYGDNLFILREHIADETVDLVYLDPPFNSNATYNVLFKSPTGEQSAAQMEAFGDTWHWDISAERAYDEVVQSGNSDAANLIIALRRFLGENDMMAYLAMMAVRLIELHRVLKPTGSLYLHCDPTASHYLKLLLDAIFGLRNYRSEISWKRTNARGTTGKWPRLHDVLFFYSKSDTYNFRATRVKADKNKMPHTLITAADGLKYQTYELTAPGATKEGDSGQPWHGFNPNKYGRHWGNNHAVMDAWDLAGLIHWPSDGGFPRRRDSLPFDPRQPRDRGWFCVDRYRSAESDR